LLVAGPLAERTSISLVMGYGVLAAVALTAYAKLDPGSAAGLGRGPEATTAGDGSGPPDVVPVAHNPPPGCP
nr:MFS transporter [Actinomycetota bacterium]